MTRAEIEVCADIFRKSRPDPLSPEYLTKSKEEWLSAWGAWIKVVDTFIERMILMNPRFRADRFRTACGRDFTWEHG